MDGIEVPIPAAGGPPVPGCLCRSCCWCAPGQPGKGWCHQRSPSTIAFAVDSQVVGVMGGGHGPAPPKFAFQSYWPPVELTGWCGDWKARPQDVN